MHLHETNTIFVAIISLLFAEKAQAQESVLDNFSHNIVPIGFNFQDSDNEL